MVKKGKHSLGKEPGQQGFCVEKRIFSSSVCEHDKESANHFVLDNEGMQHEPS